MLFDINRFLDDVKHLGKLKSIAYTNGEEAMRVLSAIKVERSELPQSINDPIALPIDTAYKTDTRLFGWMVGKIKKGLIGEVQFNLHAMLLKNGSLVIYNPYNDIVSLRVSGSRKTTYSGTDHDLYCASLEEIWDNHTARGEGPAIHANVGRTYSWNIPSNATAVYDLLFTRVLEQPNHIDEIQYNGVLVR